MEILDIILVILLFILSTSLLGYYFKQQKTMAIPIEHFQDMKIKKTIPEIYDKFYSRIYDDLFLNSNKNEFELYNIKQYTIDNQKHLKPIFLDLGCGLGNHLKIISRYGYPVYGIDVSSAFLEKARVLVPEAQLTLGDFKRKDIYPKHKFTHITCFFFTMYYIDNPDLIFKNVNYWLKPEGFFCVHLVNRKKFDPVLEKSSSLIPFFNPQKHSEKRNTKTKLIFDKFNYLADWKMDFKGDQAINNTQFTETFAFKGGRIRKHIHDLSMYSLKYYVDTAKENGFELVKIIDLLPANHDHSYIYIFKKKFGE